MSRIPFLGKLRGGRKGQAPLTETVTAAQAAAAPKRATRRVSRGDRLIGEAITAHQRKLLTRIAHLEGRAGRAKVNSNERQRCDAERLVLTSCYGHLVQLISAAGQS